MVLLQSVLLHRVCNITDIYAAVAEWLEACDTLTMFEAAVCGRSWFRTPTGAM